MESNTEKVGEWVSIEAITPHPDNPRINDHAVDEIVKSIKRFGFSSPIIARLEDKVIIAGHTRYKAAKSLGLDKIPVRFMDLDPVDAKLLMLADNKIGEKSDWDQEALNSILNEVGDQEFLNIGWDEDEIENLKLEKEHGSNDAFEEWLDMPEFSNDKDPHYQTIYLHFENEDDVNNFAELIDQNITDKTKSLWYPAKEKRLLKDLLI